MLKLFLAKSVLLGKTYTTMTTTTVKMKHIVVMLRAKQVGAHLSLC